MYPSQSIELSSLNNLQPVGSIPRVHTGPIIYEPSSSLGGRISGSLPLVKSQEKEKKLLLSGSDTEESFVEENNKQENNKQDYEKIQEKDIPIQQKYEKIKQLGKGSYGTVWLAIRASDGKEIALKEVDISPDNVRLIAETEKEIDFLKRLSVFPECHPFITCYYDGEYIPSDGKFIIEMEYVPGKNMNQFFTDFKTLNSIELTYYYLLLVAKDLAEGLDYIHSKEVIHNDIKLENILIDLQYSPRIADFGLACLSQRVEFLGPQFCKAQGGSPYYLPPEFWFDRTRYPASDMWALGICLYIIVAGWPYPGPKIEDLMKQVRDGPAPQINTSNKQLNYVVNGLLRKEMSNRLTARQVIDLLKIIPRPPDRAIIPKIRLDDYNL